MIFDTRSNITMYGGYSPLFDLALEFLKHTNLSVLEPGKYPIQGDSVFALIQAPETAKRQERLWESHQRYIDIQYLISGNEWIGFQNTDLLTIKEPYSTERDIAFYEDNGKGFFVPLVPESFVVCFPQDAHMPLACENTPEAIKKVVIKILIP
ncbi:YhcH/YjgK/YiaL family protein [Clostridium merdae]|uniref:YhcH/YjgK/YiaL family protein n=1 Tax=Clostridium merdae TaxID=1958780 RepID=UPI000A26B638|nr:YhcH/YjgK/YiaL family protein [Clostridium merdae]